MPYENLAKLYDQALTNFPIGKTNLAKSWKTRSVRRQ
jgi:hypothetical protein